MKEKFIVIIAGGRQFYDFDLLVEKCDKFFNSVRLTHDIIIRSGGAKGADSLGEDYAKLRGYEVQSFIPNWRPNGIYDGGAGHKRNREMADGNNEFNSKANGLIAFWDSKSKGTSGMIDYAKRKGLSVRIVNY